MDVPDLDTALKHAAMIPGARHGTIEARPLMNDNPAARGDAAAPTKKKAEQKLGRSPTGRYEEDKEHRSPIRLIV
jgi:hypothetical protein